MTFSRAKQKQKAKSQKPNKAAQFEQFKKTARQLGCNESMEDFEVKFKKIVPPKRKEKTPRQ